jgi:hypothetical protein
MLAQSSLPTLESTLPRSLNAIAQVTQPPIVLVAFTRPELLQPVLDALAHQTVLPSEIIAFIDGPRNADDEPKIKACVVLLETFRTILPVRIIQRSENLGCDRNVLSALTEVAAVHDRFIYLEDDVVPTACFYDRMSRLLTAYQDASQVFSVSAYANYPDELDADLTDDFIASNRVFALGFGTWSDRWQSLNLLDTPPHYNPFHSFADIPANLQTHYTIVNQFFIEKNNKTDWVIAMTLATLANNFVHITPKRSFVKNIGCGHPDAKTYRDGVPDWINQRYDPDSVPDSLPKILAPLNGKQRSLTGAELMAHFRNSEGMWLNRAALKALLRNYPGLDDRRAICSFFLERLPVMIRRRRTRRIT